MFKEQSYDFTIKMDEAKVFSTLCALIFLQNTMKIKICSFGNSTSQILG